MTTKPTTTLIDGNQAAAALADHSLIRIENETMASLAVKRPRDHQLIMSELCSQIDAYPAFAETLVYAKPVGKNQQGEMQYARGLSIRAAEALAELWGNNRIETETETVNDEMVKVTAVFTDFQSGRVWRDSALVSRFYKTRNGARAKWDDDRFYNVVVNAEKSKRLREVILRSVSPGIKMELQHRAESAMAKTLTDDVVARIVDSFNGMGVTLAMLENLVHQPLHHGWTTEHRVQLQQVYVALRDGETTIAEVFGAAKRQAEADATPKAGEKVADTNVMTLAEAVEKATAAE
jgi:hypothetical protein